MSDVLQRILFPLASEREASTVVYCVWNPDRNAIKIGFTGSLTRRFKELKTASCDRLILLASYPGTRETEQAWHENLSEWRLSGEWFDASDGYAIKSFFDAVIRNGGGVSWS